MGLEPSFSHNTLTWPLSGAGAGMLPPEPADPSLAIPFGALQISLRDMSEQSTIEGTDLEPLPAPAQPLGEPPARAAKQAGKWPIAVVASCLLHAAIAMVLLTSPQWWPAQEDPTQVEGADRSGMMVVGNANEDQAMAGDVTQVTLVPMIEPNPVQTVEAQPVVTDEATQPVERMTTETPITETVDPIKETPAAPVTVEKVQPDQQAPENPAPQILAAAPHLPDSLDPVIQQPAITESVEPLEEVETVTPQTVEPVEPEAIQTPQVVEVVPQARPEVQEARAEKPKQTTQPKEKAEKAVAKPARRKSAAGSGGASETDAKRGIANGHNEGEAIASKGGAKSGTGNAAVSNYPGKVAAKLRRVARNLSRAAQASAHNNAQVAFVVGAGGDVRSVRLVKSSGSPGLDEAALSIIQRAAPFPPIPPQAGRASWAFTLPIGPF